MFTRRSLLTAAGTGAAALGLAAVGAAPAMAASNSISVAHFPQETSYWCGPAVIRMAAHARGAWVTQKAAADYMGTTSSLGTNLKQVNAGLNAFVPGAVYNYEYYWRDNGHMSSTEINNLYSRIVKNVNDGYGTALNWQVYPGEYPAGYNNTGTIAHHVLACGYRTNSSTGSREVLIADPASRMFGIPDKYWVPLWKIVPFIGRRGYAW